MSILPSFFRSSHLLNDSYEINAIKVSKRPMSMLWNSWNNSWNWLNIHILLKSYKKQFFQDAFLQVEYQIKKISEKCTCELLKNYGRFLKDSKRTNSNLLLLLAIKFFCQTKNIFQIISILQPNQQNKIFWLQIYTAYYFEKNSNF